MILFTKIIYNFQKRDLTMLYYVFFIIISDNVLNMICLSKNDTNKKKDIILKITNKESLHVIKYLLLCC